MILHYNKFGDGETIVILHGLFGMSDNWKTIARRLSDKYHIVTLDLRNHGRSGRDDEMTYRAMAEDVVETLVDPGISDFYLIGHSMGGKVAMKMADLYPERIKSLIILDILPIAYPPKHENVFKAIYKLKPKKTESRTSITNRLKELLNGDIVLANFLSKNLKRSKNGYSWKFNIEAIHAHYEEIGSKIVLQTPYEGKCLFIAGENSNYVDREGWIETLDDFPNAELVFIEEAGHWLHADKPDEIIEVLGNYIEP